MTRVRLEHFQRAAADIAAHGDNDTLPFDIDTQFINEKQVDLAAISFAFFQQLEKDSIENSKNKISALSIFSERLLAPSGHSGFRIATKIHPFWSIYFNGIGVAIAEALEDKREERARSYRFLKDGGHELFNRNSNWRSFREISVTEANSFPQDAVVVQTDISSFYEHISHHYIEDFIDDLFPSDKRISKQINALLTKFSARRSFGLPVGGQCSRILAELFLQAVDSRLSGRGLKWHRYVDDYVLITDSHATAYQALSFLSHSLADYGLTLNKTKTIMLSSKHYSDYVFTQLGGGNELDEASKLREIDLHFDPYSDSADADYNSLKHTVESLQVQKLLNRELEKSLPDSFLVTQIGRTLQLHSPVVAMQLVSTFLQQGNLHAFRASWSTIMRGVAALRNNEDFMELFDEIDQLIDFIPIHSEHLLQAETSLLHYLRALRFKKTAKRSAFIQQVYEIEKSETIRRACIDCWRQWKDRDSFTFLINRWSEHTPNIQRLVWLTASEFGEQGDSFKRQVSPNIALAWGLGIEQQNKPRFSILYKEWCDDPANKV